MIKKLIISLVAIIILVVTFLFWPVGKIMNPVLATAPNNFHPQSFGLPWGDHRHQGVDIFAPMNTPIQSVSWGLVYKVKKEDGKSRGGNMVKILGPGGRRYLYAHMSKILVKPYSFVCEGDTIGLVGKTGNANRPDCPPHLHFGISTIIRHDHIKDMGHHWLDPAKEIQ